MECLTCDEMFPTHVATCSRLGHCIPTFPTPNSLKPQAFSPRPMGGLRTLGRSIGDQYGKNVFSHLWAWSSGVPSARRPTAPLKPLTTAVFKGLLNTLQPFSCNIVTLKCSQTYTFLIIPCKSIVHI